MLLNDGHNLTKGNLAGKKPIGTEVSLLTELSEAKLTWGETQHVTNTVRNGEGLLLHYVPQGTKRVKYVILTPFELPPSCPTFEQLQVALPSCTRVQLMPPSASTPKVRLRSCSVAWMHLESRLLPLKVPRR